MAKTDCTGRPPTTTEKLTTPTAEELEHARVLYDEVYDAFQRMWIALQIIRACNAGEMDRAADPDELREMVLAQGLSAASAASEDALTDLNFILRKDQYGANAVDRIMATARERRQELEADQGGAS